MGRKGHKSGRNPIIEYRRLSTEDLRRRIEQCREKGDTRTAIDMAKECHRRQPSSENSDLLGRLYLERGRRLIEKNLFAEALMVLNNALNFGQGSADLLWLMFECGLRSRQYETALSALKRLNDPGERSRAFQHLADEAIARGESLDWLCEPAIREDVRRIRRAFSAFEKGDDPAVTEELKGVGLTSPCARWKWLLLGLAAYTRGDHDRARLSWDKCGTEGRPGRLAAMLRSGLLNDGGDGELTPALRDRLVEHFGSPRLKLLRQIKEHLDGGDVGGTLEGCARLLALVEVNEREAFAQRLARAVCEKMGEDEDAVQRFNRVFGPLPEDPHLYRPAALSLEDSYPSDAIDAWSCFIDTLEHVKAIPPHLFRRAKALVLRRMGELAMGTSGDDAFTALLRPITGGYNEAISYYKRSLQEYADDKTAHEKLMAAYLQQKQLKKAERHARKVLCRWPNDVNTLLFLGLCCIKRNAYCKALNYLKRALRVDPFHNKIREHILLCYLKSARRRLKQGNLDQARQDYEQAQAVLDPMASKTPFFCRWAALEWRAEKPDRAQELLSQALAGREERVVVYFVLATELSVAEAPLEVQQRFDKLLEEALADQPSGEAAAQMAEHVLHMANDGVDDPKSQMHADLLVAYLSRAARQSTFSEPHLLQVCKYLQDRQEWKLLERLAHQGCDQFVGNPRFPVFLGNSQRGLGHRRLPADTRRLLERAYEQSKAQHRFDLSVEISLLLDDLPSSASGTRGSDGFKWILDALARMLAGKEPNNDVGRKRSTSRSGKRQAENLDVQGVFDWMRHGTDEEN
ncbi:MAG: tetratricopeptide repeat protein [Phycisphaerae bacterium]